MIRYQWEITVWYVVILSIIALLVYALAQVVHGDDNENELGLCLRGYSTHCQPTLQEQLLERAREWNIQKTINETLATAERFNCDYDESLCVLGHADPDFGDDER